MRVMIAGGGTGGHVIPALAIAGALKSAYAAEVCFIGTAKGMETRLVPQAGYALELIDVGQLNRVSLATQLKTMVALPRGIFHCLNLLRRWRPQVVVGVGGYASGPAMLAALLRRLPTLAFEPNAVPGLANRLIGRRISAAAVNFAPTLSYFRNAELTGIPVRAEFFALPPRPPESAPRLLVMGGSQGARALNQKMPEIARELLDAVPGLTILHQAGARHAETTEVAYTASGASADRWRVQAFLEDMPKQFAASDLILARSQR
jgi:UDP-N-acetylglucosamine--N-acetylmuramyl-(pentapeptide) pyrophosphoryl-undecaprenol N-acetylglucosamine transferase